MLQRVMPGLMGMKDIWVLNDEGHHCYRHKPGEDVEGDLKGDDRIEAENNNEAARVWISGGARAEPDCSPDPLDVMAIYTLYQTRLP